ncbi:ribosome maturation factor RimM [Helicobacter mehlei]|uniref:Ribosome maturation factor RimM n=1 Tax=Helicobacter mehlei TaxID=2316080 RepID=A0A553V0J5_9HELI|nr:ribosome maturation factor RimM [Helicobacter mehlei]TSA85987.1 16S rRNA processing protein RimM [Helicobacter mehlei]
MQTDDLLVVGRLGRSVGLLGGLKLFLQSDCLECLVAGAHVYAYTSLSPVHALTIRNYSHDLALIFFDEIASREQARLLSLHTLAMSQEETLKYCHLQEGEFLYCQLLNLEVLDGEEVLGRVASIERLAGTDYLYVQTPKKLFLIPYIDVYILHTDLENRRIYTQHARGLLEQS